MKQVQHGHTNPGKRTRVKAQAGEQVGEGKQTRCKQITRGNPDKCWLWHHLGNPCFFVMGDSNNSPIVAKPVQILPS